MIYAFNAIPEGAWRGKVLASLNRGIGRFGWSYDEAQNLNSDADFEGKQKCNFLRELLPDDYVVYINLPNYGQCTLARVTGTYFFQEPMDEDFNHCFYVDASSVRTFDRNDSIVPPIISARLKLQNRYWRIYFEDDFNELIKRLDEGNEIKADYESKPRVIEDNIKHFFDSASDEFESLIKKIYIAHPNFDLEKLMCRVFENSKRFISVEPKRGGADKGADIILISNDFPSDELQRVCLVQVKSYGGTMDTTSAIDGLRKAFEHEPDASCALIVTTATSVTDAFLEELNEFGKLGKPVALLYGKELAKYILRNL